MRCAHGTVEVVEEAIESIVTVIYPDGETQNDGEGWPTGMAEVKCLDCGVWYRLSHSKPPKRTPKWVRKALDTALGYVPQAEPTTTEDDR